jgi:glutathione S-transferase
MWQRRVEFSLFESVRAVFRHSVEMVKVLEPVQITEWAALNRPRVTAALEMFEEPLANHPFIAGKSFTVADITAVLPLQMMGMLGIEVPPRCRAVARWREAILSRPSVAALIQAPAGKD